MNNSFAPAPFWFLNHRLEDTELLRQLHIMKESGVSGFFIHPRAGLLTPYGSTEWFQKVRLIVEEAARLGLQAWLYDEDPYPSGAAGGRITMENAAFIARRVCCKIVDADENGMFRADLGETAKLITAFTYVPQEDDTAGERIDVSGSVGILRRMYHKSKWNSSYYCDWIKDRPYCHERAETFIPHLIFEHPAEKGRKAAVIYTELVSFDDKYDWVPDCLNRDCARRFIELTYDKYKEWVGDYFGTTIPGIFTDEAFAGGGWTEGIEDAFEQLHGYPLVENLHKLWIGENEDCRAFRRDYWATVGHLYRENFFGQIADWCQENNLQLVGHMVCEEDPLAHPSNGGGAYAMVDFLDIPGFDILGQNLGNRERPALLFGAHSVSSAARQQGKKRVLSENMGCNPYSFGPQDMLRVTNWLFSQGINWMVPHGFHYSYDGNRKHDAGKSFFFQDAYFREFPRYAKYADVMGARLAEGTPVGTTALLLPSERIAGYKLGECKKATAIRESLFRAVAGLVGRQIEYEIVNEETLRNGRLSDGAVYVGERRYTQLLIPYAEESSLSVDRLTETGVRVLFAENGQFDWNAVEKMAVRTHITGDGAMDILSNRLAHTSGDELFLFNNAETPAFIHVEGQWAVWEPETDVWYRPGDTLALSGYGACYLRESSAEELAVLPPVPPTPVTTYPPLVQEWTYRPEQALVTLSDWEICAKTATGACVEATHEFCRLREIVGTELTYMTDRMVRPIFDAAPRVPSAYPVAASYTAHFEMPETDDGVRRLLMEGSTMHGDWEMTLNGHPITAEDFAPVFVYDFTNRAADVTRLLCEGQNTLIIRFANGEEFDGVESALYIV